jgi:hypothetical protein
MMEAVLTSETSLNSSRLHDEISHNSVIFIRAAVRALNLPNPKVWFLTYVN